MKKRAGCILYSKNHDKIYLLVVKSRKKQKWSIPKGKLNENNNENYEGTARREFYEETGLNIDAHKFMYEKIINNCYSYFFEVDNNFKKKNENLKTNDTKEIDDVRWICTESLKQLNCNKILKKVIEIV
jgi:ADP-ribose pyrophosphatase YjhB (NUDIX family)